MSDSSAPGLLTAIVARIEVAFVALGEHVLGIHAAADNLGAEPATKLDGAPESNASPTNHAQRLERLAAIAETIRLAAVDARTRIEKLV